MDPIGSRSQGFRYYTYDVRQLQLQIGAQLQNAIVHEPKLQRRLCMAHVPDLEAKRSQNRRRCEEG